LNYFIVKWLDLEPYVQTWIKIKVDLGSTSLGSSKQLIKSV